MANKLIPQEVKEVKIKKNWFDKVLKVTTIVPLDVIDMSNKIVVKTICLDEALKEGEEYTIEIVHLMQDFETKETIEKNRTKEFMKLKKIEIKSNASFPNVTYVFEKDICQIAFKTREKEKEKEALSKLVDLVINALKEDSLTKLK